mmetsp:Transcript_16196/g.30617  ORF Transcript_16196/g.30617 Transcript_16196/m.30617 type:complete len:494 (+) Transcript_16196:57-1538(+)
MSADLVDTSNEADDFLTLYKVQICTGSISFLASLAMATSIQFSKRKLSTPYRRLVYGLCVADIIQSISIITGPFAPPAETPHGFWARGNIATCNVNGFMFSVGFTAIPMYILALAVYYLFKLKRRMSDEVFRAIYEVRIHKFIILWHLATNIVSLSTETFNPEVSGSYCFPNEYPVNCNVSPELYGECERGKSARIISIAFLIGPCLICCVSICVCMGRLICHAFSLLKLSPPPTQEIAAKSQRRLFQKSKLVGSDISHTIASVVDTNDSSNVEGQGNTDSGENIEDAVQDRNVSRLVVQELSLLYRREMLTQALSFIGAFLFIYILPFVVGILNIMKVKPGPSFMTVLSGIYPLGGLFNILVHTRPNIAALRRREGYQISWPRAFLRVLLAGGDIPEDAPKRFNDENIGLENKGGQNVGTFSRTNGFPGFYVQPASKDENSWSKENVVSFRLSSLASFLENSKSNPTILPVDLMLLQEEKPSTENCNDMPIA